MPFRRLLAIILCLAVSSWACSQSVRFENDSYGSSLRSAYRASEKQGFGAWRNLVDGDRTTQVHFYFTTDNVDVLVYVPFDISRSGLLNEGKRIAAELGLPKIDFIEAEGRLTRKLDIELNDYIQKQGRESSISVDLSKLVGAIEGSKLLPTPIHYFIRPVDAKYLTWRTGNGAPRQDLEKNSFFDAKLVPPDTTLEYRETLPSWLTFLPYLFTVLLLTAMTFIVVMPWKLAQQKLKVMMEPPASLPQPEEPKPPEKVQEEYFAGKKDRIKLTFIQHGVPFIAIPFIALMSLGRDSISRMPTPPWMTGGFATPFVIFIPALMSGAAAFVFYRVKKARLNLKEVEPTPEQAEMQKAMRPIQFMFIPMLLMMLLLMFMPVLRPYLRGFSPTVIRIVIFSFIGLSVGTTAYLMIRDTRRKLTKLKAGDRWHDFTQRIASSTNTRVREVRLNDTDEINASASLFRVVTLNRGLLEKLPEAEIQAIIAHEVGHIHSQHVPKGLLVALAVEVPMFVGFFWLMDLLEAQYSISLAGAGYFIGMLISTLAIPIVAFYKRKAERAADSYAVATMGDRHVVERALVAIHTHSEAPHELTAFDEFLATHPSLRHRIEHLRREYPDVTWLCCRFNQPS